jgi:hypothetical protein
LSTAVFAARAGRVVEPEETAVSSALSIWELATEPSLSVPDGPI